MATSKCIVSLRQDFLCDLSLFTKSAIKIILFLFKFYALCERSSDIASLVEHRVYSNIYMYSVIILVFYFDWSPFNQREFLYFSGTHILCKSSEWLLLECILRVQLYSNFRVYSLLPTVFFLFFDSPKVL